METFKDRLKKFLVSMENSLSENDRKLLEDFVENEKDISFNNGMYAVNDWF